MMTVRIYLWNDFFFTTKQKKRINIDAEDMVKGTARI